MLRELTIKMLTGLCFTWGFTWGFAWVASTDVHAAPFSSIVLDASSGRTLQQYRANQPRYPASLTKLMTVYLMLEEIETGRLHPNTKIHISRKAARQPASKLGVRKGSHISAQMAMQALIVKSANDVATAVAEHISGSERKFARRMSQRARQIGLRDTRFINASGLYHRQQQTTARDMALLAQKLLEKFPQFETLWQSRKFEYNGKIHRSHNHILHRLPGAIGMKTGYIRASGYNISTVVRRGGRMIIVVVLGGRTAQIRDRHVTVLTERSLPWAQQKTAKKRIANPAKLAQASLWLAKPVNDLVHPAQGLALTDLPRDWKIQVGAYSASTHARSQLQRIRRVLGPQLLQAEAHTERTEKNGRPIYRARFANLSEPQAYELCRKLLDVTRGCLPIAP